jgi:hypothetical protein
MSGTDEDIDTVSIPRPAYQFSPPTVTTLNCTANKKPAASTRTAGFLKFHLLWNYVLAETVGFEPTIRV